MRAPVELPEPPPTSPHTFEWESNGDLKDVLFFMGQNYGAGAWVNPHTAGLAVVSRSSVIDGTNAEIVDRAISYTTTDNIVGEWIKIALPTGVTLVVTDYSIQNGSNGSFSNTPRNWIVEGSNDDSTWTTIDTKVNDTSIAFALGAWSHFILGATPAAYRYFRFKTTGPNNAGLSYLQVGEIQLYGTLTWG
jgi:hypothetical protein